MPRNKAEIPRVPFRGPLHSSDRAEDNVRPLGGPDNRRDALFADRIPKEGCIGDAALKDAGGAVILGGKLNLHEFAAVGTSAVSYFGPVHNPWILDRAAGGLVGRFSGCGGAQLIYEGSRI